MIPVNLRLADAGKLHERTELSAQVRRMIQDRLAWSFIEQFTEQWLDLERLERVGAVVSTVESSMFELLERAGTPEFKAVQKLII